MNTHAELSEALDTVLADMYLDYLNNYITVESFADACGLSKAAALEVIEDGREIHESHHLTPNHSQNLSGEPEPAGLRQTSAGTLTIPS